MNKQYWNDLFENYDSEIFDVAENDKHKIIEAWLSEVATKRKSVADLGCGIGKWLPFLAAKFREVLAADFTPSFIKYCRSRYGHLKKVNFASLDMSKTQQVSKKYNVILCVNSILMTNLSKRQNFFQNIHTFLVKGGHLILVVPSLESALFREFVFNQYSTKAEQVKSSGEFKQVEHGVVSIHHTPTKHYLREELIFTLTALGFQINKMAKVEYEWSTEIEDLPVKLKDPYPWDWVVMAKKK